MKFKTMLTINGQINEHPSRAPRSTWRYAVCSVKLSPTGKGHVADVPVVQGFKDRHAAEVCREQLERMTDAEPQMDIESYAQAARALWRCD